MSTAYERHRFSWSDWQNIEYLLQVAPTRAVRIITISKQESKGIMDLTTEDANECVT